jgi:flagellar biosynthesis/type III secretory pathway protein FliH
MQNPKKHDALFKWLITSFTEEFFGHYFPDIRVGQYRFMDKEFISRYEALRESLEDDLFLIMEVEMEGAIHEVVIQIEHVSKKTDVSVRMYEYLCYAWLLKRKPVWSIVIYTDDSIWRKPVTDSFWFGFSSQMNRQLCHFDVIKVNSERSADLIQKHSLMCKLLALKADDRDTDRGQLVADIYRTASQMVEVLDNDRKLLIDQWVNAYHNLRPESLEQIKKEVNMSFTATTISEHIRNEGKIEGKLEGKLEGKIEGIIEGEIKGQIKILEDLYFTKILTLEQFEMMINPLRNRLQDIQRQVHETGKMSSRTARVRRRPGPAGKAS